MGRGVYTPEILSWMRENYPRMTLRVLCVELNKRFGMDLNLRSVRAATRNHNIKSGRTGQFQRGHQPFNKGVKGWDAGGRSEETRFKPGRKSQTWAPIGTEVIDRDGYRKIKVSDDRSLESRFNWRYVHRLEWEKYHGPIPKGQAVVFIDGDKSNCDIENLDILTRAELARLNQTFAGLEHDTELRRAAIATAKLKTALHSKARAMKERKAA